MNRRRIIHYCSAPCGSGKTYNIYRRAIDLAEEGRRVLVVQPTSDLNLIGQKDISEIPFSPPCRVFNGATVGHGKAAKELLTYARRPPDNNEVVFATHQVLPFLNEFPNKSDWDLIVDEELQVIDFQTHRLPQNYDFITDHLEIESGGSIYGRIGIVDPECLDHMAKNKHQDEINEAIAQTLRVLANPHWDNYVHQERYEKLHAGKEADLTLYSLLKPSVVTGFHSIFMAAANFEDTALFTLWDKEIAFLSDETFKDKLRFSQHQNGRLIDIYYLVDRPWSKRLQGLLPGSSDSKTVLDHLLRATANLFIDTPLFLWQMNKAFDRDPFGTNGHRLPNKPHGLNTYSDVHDLAFMSALNPKTDQILFLQSMGLSGDAVRAFTYFATVYQSVLRTSIRDPQNQDSKRILVPDRAAAEYLLSLFPGARVHKLDVGIPGEFDCRRKPGRPRLHEFGRERVAAHRKIEQTKQARIIGDQVGLNLPNSSRNEMSLSISQIVTPTSISTIYKSTTSKMPLFYLDATDPDSFVQLLRQVHERKITDKTKSLMMAPAIYDPDKSDAGWRKKSNIVHLQHIYLDFENGKLKPEDVPSLFPGLRMIVTNTFRHTDKKPRFRVIILTSKRMTTEVYSQLYEQIGLKLEDAGYETKGRKNVRLQGGRKPSGLDWNKRVPTSLFFMPCQAEDHWDSFFIDYSVGRSLLDPIDWIENSFVPATPKPTPRPFQEWLENRSLIEAAIEEWRRSTGYPGEGNSRFYTFAVSLKKAGMSREEIEGRLWLEAASGRSPTKRRHQIPSIMKSLDGDYVSRNDGGLNSNFTTPLTVHLSACCANTA